MVVAPSPGRLAVGQVRQAVALLRAASAGVAGGRDAAVLGELVGLYAAAGRLAEAATLRCARALSDEGCRHRLGAVEAALVAEVTGTSLARAKGHLAAIEQAAGVPALGTALAEGTLSVDQVAAIAPVAAEFPGAVAELVAAAKGRSLAGLRAVAERHRRLGRGEGDQVAHEAQLFARRRCRAVALPGGGVRVDALLGVADGARFLVALDKETDDRWRRSVAAGDPQPKERLAADALVALVVGGGHGVRTEVRVRVDAAALARGGLDHGEVCEVAGVGEISVASARSLLGDALVRLLVTTGDDVRTITSPTRLVPRRLRVALEERDPTCVVPGCTEHRHLEIDHWRTDFSLHGPTELDNLCRLCPAHHRLKTVAGWRIGGGPGAWRWIAPRGP